MRIQDIMSKPALVCGENETANEAARLMWEHDCGVIPVVKNDGRISGIVTDRDICMAAYTKGRMLAFIPIAEAMSRTVFSCRTGDSLESAERIMSDNQVRRLPVLDDDDRPVGVVSFGDVVRYASTMVRGDGIEDEVIKGLAAISLPRRSGPQVDAMPPLALRPSPAPQGPRSRRQQKTVRMSPGY